MRLQRPRGRPTIFRRGLTVLVAAALTALLPGLAVAAAPANDLPGGAIAITAVPATIDQDTSEATVTFDDDIGCGSGGLDRATVWYTLTLADPASLLVDASGSDYAVGVNLFQGSAASANLIACAEQGLSIEAEAGVTYFLMFADIDEDGVNGGQLHVEIDTAPPPIEVTLSVDPGGKVNPRTGEATVTGTISCSSEPDFTAIELTLRQSVGRFIIRGFGFDSPPCGPEPSSWWMSLTGDNGTFSPGRATVDAFAFACDPFQCGDAFVSANVRLRK